MIEYNYKAVKHTKHKLFSLTGVCFLLVGLLFFPTFLYATDLKQGLKALLTSYPNHLAEAKNNIITWKDGTKMRFDDGKDDKTFEELLNMSDLEDQLSLHYPTSETIDLQPDVNFDPGRFRSGAFFRKMYGESKEDVLNNLVTIQWMPETVNKDILFTRINGANLKLQAISQELDRLPAEFKKYVSEIAGTFNWRKIAGTDRLSMHSFGIAIDIKVKHSHYWRWNKPGKDGKYKYRNNIPIEIVNIFEKNGFIWGGRWYHYDTMHFEYRPELTLNVDQIGK